MQPRKQLFVSKFLSICLTACKKRDCHQTVIYEIAYLLFLLKILDVF